MANLAGWPYWKVVSITGQAGSGTDYQVKLTIGDSAGGDFHSEGHCTNFPQDIRITDDGGTTLLDHFVEDLTADPIVVRVEVKDDLGSNQDIRIYYGKSGETTASNITNTMLFGDDFSGDLSKWSGDTASYSISGGELQNTPIASGKTIYSNAGSLSNTIIEAKIKTTDASTDLLFGLGYRVDASNRAHFNRRHYVGYERRWGDGATYYSTVPPQWTSGTYGVDRVIVGATVAGSTHSFDGTTVAGVGNYGSDISTNILIRSYGAGTPGVQNVDHIFVRKYNSPEPAFSSAGAEQSPTGVSPTGVFYGPLVGPFGGPI